MEIVDKEVRVCEFWQTDDYDKNYDRSCDHDAEYICECCGRKLNPKTMKQVQMLTSGDWTDETLEVPASGSDRDKYDADGQGFFYIGPKCYKEIMKRIHESNITRKVRVIKQY